MWKKIKIRWSKKNFTMLAPAKNKEVLYENVGNFTCRDATAFKHTSRLCGYKLYGSNCRNQTWLRPDQDFK